jgi:hypothetical protein
LEDGVIVKIKGETDNSLFYDLLVRPQVLNYAYDDRFIIAYQVYDGSEYYNSNQIAEEKGPSRYSPWMTFTLTTQNIM